MATLGDSIRMVKRLDARPGVRLQRIVEALDHHVSRLDESGRRVSFFQPQFAHGVGGNNGGDVSFADGEDDLGEQAFHAEADDLSHKLVAAADAAKAFPGGSGTLLPIRGEEWLEGGLGDAVMSAWRLGGFQLAGQDPLLDGRVADPQEPGCFAGRKHRVRRGIKGAANFGSGFACHISPLRYGIKPMRQVTKRVGGEDELYGADQRLPGGGTVSPTFTQHTTLYGNSLRETA